jgi:hypothetical protein
MSKTSYSIQVGGEDRLTFRADFSRAADNIQIETAEPGEFDSTPFQVADARHRPAEAARLVLDYAKSQGGAALVDEDEEWELVILDD